MLNYESFYDKINFETADKKKEGSEIDPKAVEQAKVKKRIFISLMLSLGILQTLYMNLAAFYPPHARKYYPWIEEG